MELSQLRIEDDEQRLLRRYLLGELDERERERLEQAYFADADLYTRLLEAEDDLLDAYVRGELTDVESKRFEQRFRNSEGQLKRIEFASMLQRTAAQRSTVGVNTSVESLGWWSKAAAWLELHLARATAVAVAACVLVAATLGVRWWVLRQNSEPQGEIAVQQANPPPPLQPTPEQLGAEGNNSGDSARQNARPAHERQPQRQSVSIVVVILQPGLARDGGAGAQVTLSRATKRVQLQLQLRPEVQAGSYSSYQVVIQTAGETEVIKRRRLKTKVGATGQFLSLSIPARLLTKKDYVVLLYGERPAATQQYLSGYSFSVTRKW